MDADSHSSDPLEKIDLLHQMAEEAGRDPASIELTIYGCPMDADIIERYRAAGAHRVVFWLPATDESEVLEAVERGAAFIDDYNRETTGRSSLRLRVAGMRGNSGDVAH